MRRFSYVVLCSAFAAQAAVAAPCAGFTDVDDSSAFCGQVEWMKNRGITLGLTPTLYDPNSPVTRLQMAAFMYRLGFQNAFLKDGNAFGSTAVLGTTDNHALDIRVNNGRVMRYEPRGNFSPNVIGGHAENGVATGVEGAAIGGGGASSSVNFVSGPLGTIGGGASNVAGDNATVGGGAGNDAIGIASTVAGGVNNTAGGTYSFAAGGFSNTASGLASFAAGRYARANADDCAVFSLWGTAPGMQCFGVPSQFNIGAPHGMSVDYFSQRADGGGTRFVYIGDRFPPFTIVVWNGATLSDGGVWTNASDAASKAAFADVDKAELLRRLAALPIRSWRYQVESDGVRHIGPTAQDFMAAFGLGHNDKSIGTVDADGVALAAIQALNAKLESKLAAQDAEVRELRTAIEALARQLPTDREALRPKT